MIKTDGTKNAESALQEVKYVPPGESDVQKYQPENAHKRDTFFLYFAVFLVLLPLLDLGGQLVWFSSTYPSLISNNTSINPLGTPATTADVSLIAGFPPLLGLVGPLLLTKLSDKLGRKLCLHIFTLAFFLSNVAQAISVNVTLLIIARSSVFAFSGAYAVSAQVYMSEICESHNKARFMCLMGLAMPLGNIYAFFFGPLFDYRTYTHIVGIPLLPTLIFLFLVPESPVFLLSKGRNSQCRRAVAKFRSNKSSKELDKDINEMIETLKATQSHNDKGILDLFKTKEARIGLGLTMILGNAMHFCGLSTVMSFLGPLLSAAGTNLPENTMTVSVGVCQALSTLCASFFVEKFKRKTMILVSLVACGLPFVVWGIFYYLQSRHSSLVPYLQWVPLFCVIISTFFFCGGFGAVAPVVTCELFPSDLISAAISVTLSASGFFLFGMISAYPFVVEAFGVHWCFWIYGSNYLIFALIIYKCLPETKGKSIVEIQEILKNY